MVEAVLGCLVAIALTYVASGLTSLFKGVFNSKAITEPNIHQASLPITADSVSFVTEPQNLIRSKTAVEKLHCYVFSYFATFLAVYIPFNSNEALQGSAINLMESRLAFDIVVEWQYLPVMCAILSIIAFGPLWKIAQLMASAVAGIASRYTAVGELKYLSFTVLSMVFLAVFISGNLSWSLNPEAIWFESIKLSLIFCFFYLLCAIHETN